MTQSGDPDPLLQPHVAGMLASADSPSNQQLLAELAVFYAQLEASSQVSSEHVQAAVCMQFSMTRGDGSIETAPQAAAPAPAPAPVRQPHAGWAALRAKLDASLAPLGPMILDAWHRRPFRQWKPTRRGYIAAGAAAAAISGLVALGRFGSSMPTPPEPTAPPIIDPVPVAVAPVTPELAPPDKQEAVPAAAPPQPVHARRRRRVRHRPPGG